MNFIVPLEIYPFDIMFSIGETNKKLKTTLKKTLPHDAYKVCLEDDCLFNISSSQMGRTILIVDHWQTVVRFGKNPTVGTVAHEIFHAVEFLFMKLCMPLSKDNDEAYAYLIGYITDKFYSVYKP